ncbi:MAG: B12-binding domain-containing radical SAM protein [Candidatus Moranbacteria bacterium]|nr:B12-binding domain-containing radical SAM protein [Candidatus Moranbacteria bacterium]
MNVLLVYPECTDTFWSFKHALKFTGKKAAFPPLGLLTVGAMIPRQWKTVLVDENVERLTEKMIEASDIILVSAMLAQSEATELVLTRCRALGKRTVLGGPMATADPERFSGLADHLVLGEAELTFPRFLRDIESGNIDPVYKPEPNTWADLRETPIPRWDLVRKNMHKYSSMAVQSGRGCVWDCEFCNVIDLFGRRIRLKSESMVVAELESLRRTGWKGSVFFVDDNFIANIKKAKLVLAETAKFQEKHGYPFQFYTQVDITLADDEELIDLMRRAVFFRVFIGIETPEIESLIASNKHQNVGVDVPKAVGRLLSAGIQVQAGFVIGFDSDTGETFGKMIRFIQETGIMTAMVGTLQALPGTKLYKRLESEGRLLGKSTGDNTDGSVGYIPKNMSPEELEKGYGRIVSAIYSPERYDRRLQLFLLHYRPNDSLRQGLSWGGTQAFFLSMVLIGFFSRARKWYWKSLFGAMKNNIRALPAAIEHWVLWYHFHIVARKVIGADLKPVS